MQKPKSMDTQDIESLVKNAVDEAVDFIESEIAPARIKSQRYFDGQVDLGHEEGRSKVVSTKVRDTIRGIKPSLLRTFLSTDKVVEYVPEKPEDVLAAEQASTFINWRFRELGGYKTLNDAFHDALVKKTGVVKAYWETYTKGEIFTYDNLSDEEFALIVNDDEVQVLEHSQEVVIDVDEMGAELERNTHAIKISRQCEEGKLCIESVPPEEFFVDRNATCIEDAYVVAHITEKRVGDLVDMGFEWDDVVDLTGVDDGSTMGDAEELARTGYSDLEDDQSTDPSMKLVQVCEAYMRMDIEGTGSPMLYRIITGGNGHKLLDYELWDDTPFAVFEVDPEPHAFFGRSVADLIMADQDAATSMLRGALDNIALTNNPRLEVLDDLVNLDDLLNPEIGAIIRTRQIGSVQPLMIPNMTASVLPMMQYFDDAVEVKTGVSRASLGLDPDALQNTTATAAQITAQQAAGQVEVIARNLAETGMKRLFKLMMGLVIKHSPDQQIMRLNNQFVPVDPRVWNTSMDMMVNVGLGTGQEDVKLQALQQTLQTQQMIWQSYGPQNGLVTMTQMRNTLADILRIAGYYNADRYYNPMNPQLEQQLLAQQAQQAAQQQQQGDPASQAYLQAEQIKAQVKMQTEMAKIQATQQAKAAEMQQRQQIRGVEINAQQQAKIAELQQRQEFEMAKLQKELGIHRMDDDRERDRMLQDMYLRSAEIAANSGVAIDTARIQAEQAAPRDAQGNI